MPITAQFLAAQRAAAALDYVDTCEIHRFTQTRSSMGEVLKSWAPLATGVSCRVVAVNSITGHGERARLAAIAQVTSWMVVLPWNQDVNAKDLIYVTSQSPTRRFEVTQVLGPHVNEVRRLAQVDEVT